MNPAEEPLPVIYEDNHLLAVNKPAGCPSAHFEGEVPTADHLMKGYLKAKYQKPGNVFLGVVHRLDRPVSGVLLFARTTKAASRLGEQFRLGTVQKTYWAFVDEPPGDWPPTGTLTDWLWHHDAAHRVEVVPADSDVSGAQLATLTYSTLGRFGKFTWLELTPHTGRKHQLRVQLASRGLPILGDRKYGSRHALGNAATPAVALHAHSLSVSHPTLNTPLTLTAEVPAAWRVKFPGFADG